MLPGSVALVAAIYQQQQMAKEQSLWQRVVQQQQHLAAERLNSPAGPDGGLQALAAFVEVLKATAACLHEWEIGISFACRRGREVCELPGDAAPSRTALEQFLLGILGDRKHGRIMARVKQYSAAPSKSINRNPLQ